MMLSIARSLSSALFFVCFSSCMQLQFVAAEDLADFAESASNACDRGPDALTTAYGKSIPQTCLSVPFGDDGETSTFVERCFYTYIPESCSDASIAKAPLVVDVHGVGSCALFSAFYTGWMQKAEEECIVVVWPNGRSHDLLGSCFNVPGFLEGTIETTPCCCLDETTLMPTNENVDTVFLKMAIDTTVESLSEETTTTEDAVVAIDTDRIYMAGHSNGCMMSVAMAALYSDTITAVCCHAGAVLTPFPEDYTPVPIWMLHGTADETIPYEGNYAIGFFTPFLFLSMDESMSILADANGCSEEEEIDLQDDGGSGDVIGTIHKKTNCKENASVEIVTMFGVNHHPYKGLEVSNTQVDTTAMAWEFCSSHSKAVVEEDPVVVETSAPEESEEPEVEVEEDPDSGEDAVEDSSAPTPKSFSMVLAIWLFLGAVGVGGV